MPSPVPGTYQILKSNLNDLELIFSLFRSAIEYQTIKGYNLWPEFDRQLIEAEIAEGRHWKLMDGETIASIFSVMYNDPVIWKERDLEPAVYLHRIAVDPLHKGKGMMKHIRQWAIQHAQETKKQYVRMDTWGNNENLKQYYISCGFTYIGQQYLEDTQGLPSHYGGNHLSLFQIEACLSVQG